MPGRCGKNGIGTAEECFKLGKSVGFFIAKQKKKKKKSKTVVRPSAVKKQKRRTVVRPSAVKKQKRRVPVVRPSAVNGKKKIKKRKTVVHSPESDDLVLEQKKKVKKKVKNKQIIYTKQQLLKLPPQARGNILNLSKIIRNLGGNSTKSNKTRKRKGVLIDEILLMQSRIIPVILRGG